MDTDFNKNPYCAAFAEASSELEKISCEIEELRLRRSRIEKAVAVLKCQIDFDPASPILAPATPANPTVTWKRALMPGFKVETRVRFNEAED